MSLILVVTTTNCGLTVKWACHHKQVNHIGKIRLKMLVDKMLRKSPLTRQQLQARMAENAKNVNPGGGMREINLMQKELMQKRE